MKNIVYLLLVISILSISCAEIESDVVSLEPAKRLLGEQINAIDNLCCIDILIFDSLLVINDWCNTTGFITFYTLYPITKLGSYIHKGVGPEEFLSPFFFESNHEEKSEPQFSIFDLNNKLIRDYSLEKQMLSSTGGLFSNSTVKIPEEVFPALNLSRSDSIYYGHQISEPSGLFFRYNLKTEKKKSTEFRPILFNKKFNGTDYSMLYYNKPIVNKPKDRIVTAMKYFNEIYFYDLNLDHFKTVLIGDQISPKLYNNVEFSDDSYICTLDMCGTDDYVYLLYDNKMVGEYESGYWETSLVIVFDWEGTHIKNFEIDRSSNISVDPTNSFLISFSRMENGETCFYKYSIGLN